MLSCLSIALPWFSIILLALRTSSCRHQRHQAVLCKQEAAHVFCMPEQLSTLACGILRRWPLSLEV